jgi:predicted nucleic acid-binding protein
MTIFVDTDVVLDLLSERHPFYDDAAQLFSLADKGAITLVVSSLCFSNLNYILSKQYSAASAKRYLQKFKTLVTVAAVTDKIVDLALLSTFKDFEDALQHYTALSIQADAIVTRNIKDYKSANINVFTPQQLLLQLP